MKLSELNHHLTPGEIEIVKQAFRQGFDWRECLRLQCPDKDAALLEEIAVCLAADVFAKLPLGSCGESAPCALECQCRHASYDSRSKHRL